MVQIIGGIILGVIVLGAYVINIKKEFSNS